MNITHTDMVAAPYIPASMTFLEVVLIYFFLHLPILVLTKMKNEPRRPPIIPSIIDPGICFN